MSPAANTAPPTLPGEVWRGTNITGAPVAVTIDHGDAFAWWWRDGRWQRTNGATRAWTFTAWAMSERARADRAEALAKAERDRAENFRTMLIRAADAVISAADVIDGLDGDLDEECADARADAAGWLRAAGGAP